MFVHASGIPFRRRIELHFDRTEKRNETTGKDFSGGSFLEGPVENCASGVTETEVGHSRRKGLALVHCDNGKTRNDVGLGFRPFPGYRSTKRYDEAAPRAIIGVSCVYNTHRQPGALASSRKDEPRNLCIVQISFAGVDP